MPRVLSDEDVAGFRERLCEAAAQIFIERGRDGFNMRELAERLRVSPMTAYRYFRDKDEILAALRARAFARFADRLESSHAVPPGERSAALAAAYTRFVQEDEANYRLMFDLFQPASPLVPELAIEERRAREAVAFYARLMVDDGVFDGEPDVIGAVFWSSLHGVAALHLARKLPAPELDRLMAETVRALCLAYRSSNGMAAEQWPVLPTHEQCSPGAGFSGLMTLPAAE